MTNLEMSHREHGREQPACPVPQYSSVPAGGRSRPGVAWVGRIRSTAEKSKGCNCAWSICEVCEENCLTEILFFRVILNHLPLSVSLQSYHLLF